MALVFNAQLAEGFKYIVESEKGDKKPFSVMIKPIDSVRLVTLEDGILKRGQDNSLSISTGSYNVSLCCNAVTGWENLVDAKGKTIPIVVDVTGFISTASLEMLPTELIAEIAGVIGAVSQDPSKIQLYTDSE